MPCSPQDAFRRGILWSEDKETIEQVAGRKRRSLYNSSNLLYRLSFLICLITSLDFAICSAPFRAKPPIFGPSQKP